METSATGSGTSKRKAQIYRRLHTYDFDKDEEFKSGLSAILASATSPEQLKELTLHAKCFYFARIHQAAVDVEEYKAWMVENASEDTETLQSSKSPDESKPASKDPDEGPRFSYQEVVEMIQNGKPIPGIKEIPNTILEGQGTTPAASRRRKPWEKDAGQADGLPQMEAASSTTA